MVCDGHQTPKSIIGNVEAISLSERQLWWGSLLHSVRGSLQPVKKNTVRRRTMRQRESHNLLESTYNYIVQQRNNLVGSFYLIFYQKHIYFRRSNFKGKNFFTKRYFNSKSL
jgi:hypothetical protein